ncbi:MAG: preprotein translocase subunit SecA [Chloroflexi bacterium]|nr:preprotein translocase subunit SecA [Chloroflexota bacterium]
MISWIGKIIGDSNEKVLKKLEPAVAEINSLEPEFEKLSNIELRDRTAEFRGRLMEGESLEDILPEAFAAVREASKRTLGQRHFDVQLLGGIVLHQGKIAEMKTGEGKTLAATAPVYLNALEGRGVHVVTVNDYLAKRDTQWMGQIYHLLGLSVACIQHDSAFIYDPEHGEEDPSLHNLRPIERRDAYLADITYGTNNEFGFDYLRDNMVIDSRQCVQRELHYAIVDEVDNILIDEARTPLIISGQAQESNDRYYQFARLVPRLHEETDYEIDHKRRTVVLTEDGINKIEKWIGLPAGESIYDPRYAELTHYLEQALKAEVLFKLDRDYVVMNGEVIIVDEFTGRLMHGRRYSEGLHQAIEAKEGVKVERESQTLATITFQNYFRMYEKLAGMTGTAATEGEEFHKIYKLEVVVIPTNKPMIRTDHADQVYKTEQAKYRAVVREIEELNKQQRPVLVGTISIEKSEHLSEMLKRRGIGHQVLNAKFHEKEAGIIAQAGQPGAVTIATNMAGRGTDIVLGPGIAEKGGLHIIGTERHEARRIDNQLRGRSGRQGDPGSSRFYLSLEDDLMRRFGSERIAGVMGRLGMDEDTPIEAGLISKTIENAQTKIEGYNFDLRKHVVEYDDVMNKQREVIYGDRHKIISGENFKDRVLEMIESEVRKVIANYAPAEDGEGVDIGSLLKSVGAIMPVPAELADTLVDMNMEGIADEIVRVAQELYELKEQDLGEDKMRQLERLVMLRTIDNLWVEYLTAMDDMREGIGLRAYGQRDPLVEYKSEAYHMFQQLLDSIQYDIVHTIYHVTIAEPPKQRVAQAVLPGHQSEAQSQPAKKAKKVGRNDPCPCGSGKKYKKCCGK